MACRQATTDAACLPAAHAARQPWSFSCSLGMPCRFRSSGCAASRNVCMVCPCCPPTAMFNQAIARQTSGTDLRQHAHGDVRAAPCYGEGVCAEACATLPFPAAHGDLRGR